MKTQQRNPQTQKKRRRSKKGKKVSPSLALAPLPTNHGLGSGPKSKHVVYGDPGQMPSNELAVLHSIVDNDPVHMTQGYVATLVLPQYNMHRIPDAFAGATGLFKSCTVLKVPAYFSGAGSDSGRFALCVQPHMGSLAGPQQYKVALVNAGVSGAAPFVWPTALNLSTNYNTVIDNFDIRQDQYASTLTQQPLATISYSGAGASTTNVLPFGNTITGLSGYGLAAQYSGATLLPGVPAGGFVLPPGFYKVSMRFVDGAPTPGFLVITTTGVNGATVNIIENFAAANGELSESTFTLSVPEANSTTLPYFTVALNAVTAPLASAEIHITRTYDDIPGITSNSGLIQRYRPVGCCVLATFENSDYANGGVIAGALVPGNAVNTQFFTAMGTGAIGSLASWQNVAKIPGAYSGRLKDGAYGWYAPEDVPDYSMRAPDQQAAYQHPAMVVAGQWNPGTTLPPDGTDFLKVEIWTVYEFLTDSTLFELKHQQGSTQLMEDCLGYLAATPHFMANDTHMTFGERILNGIKKAGSWIFNNRKAIGNIASEIGTLL